MTGLTNNLKYISSSDEAITNTISKISFNADGLVPVIVQQHDTGEVLMLAWMNIDAARETLKNGTTCYWSRSRSSLWYKGEISGQVQTVLDFRWDCDADTILLLVDQSGVACHTGRRSCFFNAIRGNKQVVILDVETDPALLYGIK